MTDKNDIANGAGSDPVDAHELLAKHRMIGVVWCIQDVQEVRPDLTDDQAWEVLQEVERKHNSELGISWTTLEIFADELYPQSDREQEA
jgi:hypothetical protein